MTLLDPATQALLDQLSEALALIDVRDAELPVVFANRALAELRGQPVEELCRAGLGGLLGGSDAARLAESAATLVRGQPLALEASGLSGASGPVAVEIRFEPLKDAAGIVTHVVAIHRRRADAAAREPEPVTLPLLRRDDRLTGLRHIEFFHELFRRDFAIAQREGRQLALYVIDVDALGAYNDTFGRPSGDSVIRRVGRALTAAMRRASDLLARVDGGRFVAVAVGMDAAHSLRHGETLAQRVRELKLHHPRSKVARFVTVSVGVTDLVPGQHSTPDQMLASALRGLEAARAAGRNRVATVADAPG